MPFSATGIPRGTNPSFTSGANAANPLIPVEDQREIMKVAIEKSVVLQLARKQDMGTQLRDMPVLATKPDAYWINQTDSGKKETTLVAWKNVRLIAEELAVMVPIPLNVLADSNVDIWAQIKPEVGEAIGRALDAAVLFGTNRPTGWGAQSPSLVPGALAAGNQVTIGASTVDIAGDISMAIGALEADGFTPSGIAMRQTMRGTLRNLRDTQKQFLFMPGEPGAQNSTFGTNATARKGMIFGIDAMTTLNGVFEDYDAIPATNGIDLIVADWDQIVIGIRQDIQFDVSKEASIFDGSNVLVYNAWQQDGAIGRFTARFGYAVPNPVTRLQPTEGSRFPAATLMQAAA